MAKPRTERWSQIRILRYSIGSAFGKNHQPADLDQSIPRRVLSLVKKDCDSKTWQAFWQTTVLGDSAKDVADRLEMNVANVYQAKSRILRRIRQKLDELP